MPNHGSNSELMLIIRWPTHPLYELKRILQANQLPHIDIDQHGSKLGGALGENYRPAQVSVIDCGHLLHSDWSLIT